MTMIKPNAINAIIPALPNSDRRQTIVHPAGRGGVFSGWGPKL